jgi:hypothetical protein
MWYVKLRGIIGLRTHAKAELSAEQLLVKPMAPGALPYTKPL